MVSYRCDVRHVTYEDIKGTGSAQAATNPPEESPPDPRRRRAGDGEPSPILPRRAPFRPRYPLIQDLNYYQGKMNAVPGPEMDLGRHWAEDRTEKHSKKTTRTVDQASSGLVNVAIAFLQDHLYIFIAGAGRLADCVEDFLRRGRAFTSTR